MFRRSGRLLAVVFALVAMTATLLVPTSASAHTRDYAWFEADVTWEMITDWHEEPTSVPGLCKYTRYRSWGLKDVIHVVHVDAAGDPVGFTEFESNLRQEGEVPHETRQGLCGIS